MTQNERTECPYCGDTFESELERGIHIAEEHTDTDRKIPTKTKNRNKDPDQLTDKWQHEKRTG